MMDPVITFGLGSLKALMLLLAAGGLALVMRRGPARLRAVVWSTALVGSLLLPLVSTVMPALVVELPAQLMPPVRSQLPDPVIEGRPTWDHESAPPPVRSRPGVISSETDREARTLPGITLMVGSIWGAVALMLLLHEAAGLVRMRGIIKRASPVTGTRWLELAEAVREQMGSRRPVELVVTTEVDIPAMFGILRPVVVLPSHSRCWLDDRLEAVLQHEMVHIVRLDWPLRVAARIARAVYWFNPLVWWAVCRLHLEQEMACDEEVLSLGSRASSYACHLLTIARTAVARPVFAPAGLEMARRSHLEERIMTILNRPRHRRIGLSVILPAAVLTAALVPAIAAVQPSEPGPKPASPELKAALDDMKNAERKLQPYLDQIDIQASDIEPIIEKIEAIEIDIDHEALARIEREMEPILAQIEAVEIDMEPIHEQLEAMHEQLESMTFHIEDGTMEEVQRQISEQMEAHRELLEAVHLDMSPYHEQLEALHEQLEPLQRRMAELTEEEMAKVHEEMKHHEVLMELEREKMVLAQEEMARIHEEMAPMQEEMERMGARIQGALVSDVADVLRSHLGPVTSPGAPYREAAARIIDEGNIHIHDDVLELNASRAEVREILGDLFRDQRVGTQQAFDAALNAAVDEVSDLRILVD